MVSGDVRLGDRLFFRIADADLRGDGKLLWCGLAATKPGEATAVGFSLAGDELWSYPLPVGVPSQPIEPIITGKVTRDGAGQWLLPGPDGSIHILTADGKLLDKFNYGGRAARAGHLRERRPARNGRGITRRAGSVEGGIGGRRTSFVPFPRIIPKRVSSGIVGNGSSDYAYNVRHK